MTRLSTNSTVTEKVRRFGGEGLLDNNGKSINHPEHAITQDLRE